MNRYYPTRYVKLVIFLASLCPTVVFSEGWSFEITPYAWLAGIDGDVQVRNREADVDVGFSDLWDHTDLAGAFLMVAQHNRLVLWGQLDYMELSTGEVRTRFGGNAELDTDSLLLTTAIGYQFNGFVKGSTIDVLVGTRYLSLDNELSIDGLGSVDKTKEIIDGVLVVRPSFPIGEHWRFNPTLSIGTGDSDLTYELQPQFQYHFNDTFAARIGYRRLHYDIDSKNSEFDGAFHGFLFGLGVLF